MIPLLIFGMAVGFGSFWHYIAEKANDKHRKERDRAQARAKIAYIRALSDLAKNPSGSSARQVALETGRVFYCFEIPDTQVWNGNGYVIRTTNNSANREAKIQADIDAQIGHLKVIQAKVVPASAINQTASIATEISKLKSLVDEGVLTKEEFEEAKKGLLKKAA